MEINTRDEGDVKVVTVEGNLDTNTSPSAERHLDELISTGSNKILLDLQKLNYISSAGLRVLLATTKKLRATDGDLRVCNLHNGVQDVFEISGFNSILSVHPSLADALTGF